VQLADLREDIETLTEALQRSRFAAASGVSAALDLAPLFRAQPEAVTWESYALVKEERARSEGKRAARLNVLLHHLHRLLEDSSSVGALASRHKVEVSSISGVEAGESMSVRVALAELGLEEHREKRLELERRAIDALSQSSGAMQRRFEVVQGVAQKAGFASAVLAHASLGGIDLPVLIADAEAFLSATQAMYQDVFAWWVRRTLGLKLFPNGAGRHDWLHALALKPFEGLFPRGESVVALSGRLSAMGLSPLADKRIQVDADSRFAKTSEAIVIAASPPGQVLASVRRGRGWADTRDFLSALGTAQHFANVEASRPFEDRALGDQAVPQAMGELFAHWLLDAKWLKQVLDADVPDVPRVLGLAELARTRLVAALFLHSVQVDRDGPSSSQAKQYVERLSQALCVAWPEGLWLKDADVGLGHATALRAASLEASLAAHMRNQLDEDWWKNPRSGPYLLKLYAQGQLESAPVLAERLALGPLSLSAVTRRLETVLT
jgi:hypothetical protein